MGKSTQGRRHSWSKALGGAAGSEQGMGEVTEALGNWEWVVLVAPPGAQTAGAQAHEDGADEFAEGGGIDGLQLLLLAVQ